MAEEVVQISRQDPAIEAYRLGLLGDVQTYIKDQIAAGMPAETAYQVAGLTAPETAAIQAAGSGIGAYQPFLQAGEAAIQGGQNILTGSAMPSLRQAETTTGASQDIINQAAQLAGAQRAVHIHINRLRHRRLRALADLIPSKSRLFSGRLMTLLVRREYSNKEFELKPLAPELLAGRVKRLPSKSFSATL